jgi:hypothetical protein
MFKHPLHFFSKQENVTAQSLDVSIKLNIMIKLWSKRGYVMQLK